MAIRTNVANSQAIPGDSIELFLSLLELGNASFITAPSKIKMFTRALLPQKHTNIFSTKLRIPHNYIKIDKIIKKCLFLDNLPVFTRYLNILRVQCPSAYVINTNKTTIIQQTVKTL